MPIAITKCSFCSLGADFQSNGLRQINSKPNIQPEPRDMMLSTFKLTNQLNKEWKTFDVFEKKDYHLTLEGPLDKAVGNDT